MSHKVPFVVSVLLVSTLCFATAHTQDLNPDPSISNNEDASLPDLLADKLVTQRNLIVIGSVFTDVKAGTLPDHKSLVVQLVYDSIEIQRIYSRSGTYRLFTGEVVDAENDLLRNIPDMVSLKKKISKAQPQRSLAYKIADFKLFIISKSEGCLLSLSDESLDKLIYQEKLLVTTGVATINFLPECDIAKREDRERVRAALDQFSALAATLNCQSICVTIETSSRPIFGVCWPNNNVSVIEE